LLNKLPKDGILIKNPLLIVAVVVKLTLEDSVIVNGPPLPPEKDRLAAEEDCPANFININANINILIFDENLCIEFYILKKAIY